MGTGLVTSAGLASPAGMVALAEGGPAAKAWVGIGEVAVGCQCGANRHPSAARKNSNAGATMTTRPHLDHHARFTTPPLTGAGGRSADERPAW